MQTKGQGYKPRPAFRARFFNISESSFVKPKNKPMSKSDSKGPSQASKVKIATTKDELAFIQAVYDKDISKVEILVNKEGVSVNVVTAENHETAMYIASSHGMIEMIKKLAELGSYFILIRSINIYSYS